MAKQSEADESEAGSELALIIAEIRHAAGKLDAYLARERAEEMREARDKVLTLGECAARMRRSVQTLRRGLHDGRYPFLYRDKGRIFASARELGMWERRQLKQAS
ncbi:MAG: hypothetical protein WBQ34_10240 [Candidatus Acidiferrales bacterium]